MVDATFVVASSADVRVAAAGNKGSDGVGCAYTNAGLALRLGMPTGRPTGPVSGTYTIKILNWFL